MWQIAVLEPDAQHGTCVIAARSSLAQEVRVLARDVSHDADFKKTVGAAGNKNKKHPKIGVGISSWRSSSSSQSSAAISSRLRFATYTRGPPREQQASQRLAMHGGHDLRGC